MKEQESLKPYEKALPEMPSGTIPASGGFELVRKANPEDLKNPLPFNDASIEVGKRGYDRYCVMCHGVKAQGNGTVGQSFYPLPTNLTSPQVQGQTDGRLFYTITFGLKRHPALGYTIARDDRWAIVHHIRSLAKARKG
jgi:hypothetical protein